MAYKQTRNFTLSRMGRQTGWCLQNCRLAFGINRGHYASAKADMEAQRAAGTLHTGTPPNNVAVPVYCDTTSIYEHVVIWDRGTVYSDGVRVPNGLAAYKVFGWGELCDGERVVEWQADPQVMPAGNFLPPRGYWTMGDCDPRIGEIAAFMRKNFPAYTPAAALGNYYGPNIDAAMREFQRRVGLAITGDVGPLNLAALERYGFKHS